MENKMEKFLKSGKIVDYLEYRKSLNSELDNCRLANIKKGEINANKGRNYNKNK